MIKFYTCKKDIQNKAKTAYVTIDWFKKKFLLPIDSDIFDIRHKCDGKVPQIKTRVYLPETQGVVESIIIDKRAEVDIIHVLLRT